MVTARVAAPFEMIEAQLALANREFALPRQAGVVDGEDATAHRQQRAQSLPERTHLPDRMRDEVLQALVGTGIAQPPMHGLHRLSLAVVQQSLDVAARVSTVRSPTETANEAIEKGPKPFRQRTRRWIGHASEDMKFGRFVQVKITK